MLSACRSGNNCYALEGYAPTGDYAGYMYGGKGVYAESDDAAQPGLDGNAYGSNAYGVSGESAAYRGGYFKSDSNVLYSLYVDDVDGPTQGTAALNVRGTIRGEGNLVIGGSKAGYVVDIMQNVGAGTLEPGDVVTIVGNAARTRPNPLVTVKKANSAYNSGVGASLTRYGTSRTPPPRPPTTNKRPTCAPPTISAARPPLTLGRRVPTPTSPGSPCPPRT